MNNIPVTGLISPVYSTDTYPVIDPLFGIDGLRNVTNITDMYNMRIEKRRAGMVVGISGTSSTEYWSLVPQGNGVTWSIGNIYSNEWVSLFSGVSVPVIYPILNYVTNLSVSVPINYEYLVYGNLTIGSGGTFSNSGQVVIINGSLVISGGTYTGYNPMYVTLPSIQKYSASFSLAQNNSIYVTHSLGTSDITYTIRDGYNYIYPNVELGPDPLNSLTLMSTGTISNGRISIIG